MHGRDRVGAGPLVARYGALMLLPEYAEAMRKSPRTVRREIAAGRSEVPPVLCRPYRWRTTDVETYIDTTTLPEDRRRKAKREPADARA